MSYSDVLERLKLGYLRWRHRSERVGLAIGVFDFCHQGHVNLLRRAAAVCDRLVIGVHADETVQQYKGVRPLNSALERCARIEELDIAAVVEINSDRVSLCRRHSVDVVFHGDDWDRDAYMDHWGRDLINELGVEIELLPHTPGVTSTVLRKQTPRVGWWLYSKNPEWDRSHIFDHLSLLYERVNGVWIVGVRGRDAVKAFDPEAACAWLPDGTSLAEVCNHVAALDLDVLVTAHFNYDPLVAALEMRGHPVSLIVLSHGRSGKPGTSDDARRHRKSLDTAGENAPAPLKCVTIHDWSFADDSYVHLDGFLADGGSFRNSPPDHSKPRLLVLPTWGPYAEKRGLLLSRRWRDSLRRMSRDWDVLVSPHPLADATALRKLTRGSAIRLLAGKGRSFAAVPDADVVLTDLSGVFWESMLFDTPVLLAGAAEPFAWPDDLQPSADEVFSLVPPIDPAGLAAAAAAARGERRPEQNRLAGKRLGTIDGKATDRLSSRILRILEAVQQGVQD